MNSNNCHLPRDGNWYQHKQEPWSLEIKSRDRIPPCNTIKTDLVFTVLGNEILKMTGTLNKTHSQWTPTMWSTKCKQINHHRKTLSKEAEFYYLCWTITKLFEIIYSTAESLLWPRRLSNHFGNLRYKRTINTIWRLKKGPKLSLIIRWYTGPFKGHSPRAFQRQFMKLCLGKDLLLLYASGRAPIWETSDRHFSSWSSKQLCERSRPILPRTWPQFPHLFNKEGSITAGVLSSSNILPPTLSTIYLIRRYQIQWQDQRGQEKQEQKRCGMALQEREDCYLFLPLNFLWFALIILKLALVFQSSPVPSLLAISLCKRLLLHTTSFPLWSAWPSCQIPLASDQLGWHNGLLFRRCISAPNTRSTY